MLTLLAESARCPSEPTSILIPMSARARVIESAKLPLQPKRAEQPCLLRGVGVRKRATNGFSGMGGDKGPERVVVQAEAIEAARCGGDGSGESQLAAGAALGVKGDGGVGELHSLEIQVHVLAEMGMRRGRRRGEEAFFSTSS